MVYIPYTQENMNIFQDIKVKTGKYGYFPGSGKVALVPYSGRDGRLSPLTVDISFNTAHSSFNTVDSSLTPSIAV